jgi:hypothetical protein
MLLISYKYLISVSHGSPVAYKLFVDFLLEIAWTSRKGKSWERESRESSKGKGSWAGRS